jgi:hypothetical protein
MTDRDHALLETLVLEVAAIRRLLEGRRGPTAPGPDDEVLVHALARAFGAEALAVKDVLQRAAVDDDLRVALGHTTGRKLGKRLRRLAGRDVAGLCVVKIGDSRDGAVLRVLRV